MAFGFKGFWHRSPSRDRPWPRFRGADPPDPEMLSSLRNEVAETRALRDHLLRQRDYHLARLLMLDLPDAVAARTYNDLFTYLSPERGMEDYTDE